MTEAELRSEVRMIPDVKYGTVRIPEKYVSYQAYLWKFLKLSIVRQFGIVTSIFETIKLLKYQFNIEYESITLNTGYIDAINWFKTLIVLV